MTDLYATKSLKGGRLGPVGMLILATIDAAGRSSILDVAKTTGRSYRSVYESIVNLERQGWVTIVRPWCSLGPDGSAAALWGLTEVGRWRLQIALAAGRTPGVSIARLERAV